MALDLKKPVGWAFPIEPDLYGGIKMANYLRSVEDSIVMILRTTPGELFVEPRFGCKINEMVFSPNTNATVAAAEYYVREALNIWEPRIQITSVKGGIVKEDVYTIRLNIKFKLPALDNAESEIGYDLNLEGGAL